MPRTLWCSGLPASAREVPDPPVEAVLAYLRADYDEWGWADPMLGLFWYERQAPTLPPFPGMAGDELVAQLLAIRHPVRGFYFEYSEGSGPSGRWLASIDPAGDLGEWVPNMSCGEEAFFLAACFVRPDVSERVVADFMASPEPSAAVQWMPFQPLWPRRTEPPQGR